jgi:decaprenylphospho-beta-D-erythro-pentofuranosid-2-ulose 2-reductase
MSIRLLVVGATSAIATALARRYACKAAQIFLIGRRGDALALLAADLRVRGAAEVDYCELDVTNSPAHKSVLDLAWRRFGGVDHALIAHGVLPDQTRCQVDVDETLVSFDVNARSVLALVTDLANRFEAQRSGAMAIISSPAGDRGRASNYVYGAAKAAVSVFSAGLRHRMYRHGVRVITIIPGFVDSPMTAAMEKGPLWVSPDRVAVDIYDALAKRNGVVYTPWFWQWIMLLIKIIPERLFLRTSL